MRCFGEARRADSLMATKVRAATKERARGCAEMMRGDVMREARMSGESTWRPERAGRIIGGWETAALLIAHRFGVAAAEVGGAEAKVGLRVDHNRLGVALVGTFVAGAFFEGMAERF